MAKSKKKSWHNLPTHERAEVESHSRKERLSGAVSRWRERVDQDETQEGADYDPAAYADFPLGTVLTVRSGHYATRMDDSGELLDLRVKGSLKEGVRLYTTVAAPGDRVHVERYAEGDGLIVAVVPRRSTLSRPDPFRRHLQDVIVANVDQIVIVSSVGGPGFWHELVDRYLVYAEYHELEPLIVVNKVDQGSDAEVAELRALYEERLSYPLLLTSATTGQGIAALGSALGAHVNVVAGLSGVGKSSLLNAVQPGLGLRIGDVSDHYGGDGQHTTTVTTLYPLDNGGYLADTPGIRGFGLWDMEPAELDYHFRDFRPLLGHCRFSDCTHHQEPQCAVVAAVAAGEIARSRYESYLTLYDETDPARERHY